MRYPIHDGQTQVGKAEVSKEGMYWRIECCCVPLSGKPEKILLHTQVHTIQLGLCVPDTNGMRILKRIPNRQLLDEHLTFVVDHKKDETVRFVKGQPFVDIHRLRNARLQIRDGDYFVVISESSRPTGQ